MPIERELFYGLMASFASGVTVVTSRDNSGHLHGITVSAFCSVSLEPPLILVCIEKATGSHHAFQEAGAFVVNFLHEDQQDVSNHFASHLDDKFSLVKYHEGLDGLPVLTDALASLDLLEPLCRSLEERATLKLLDGADHSFHVPVRSGRTDAQVMVDILDAWCDWARSTIAG